jgi:predicted ArsR family transcriptional regulator
MSGPRHRTDPAAHPDLGARRTEVLACLQEAPGALGVADVADRTGLHVNTARFHLDRLVERGLAESGAERGGVRGRPRILYEARTRDAGPRSYRLLGGVMTGLVGALDPEGTAAVDAGRAWGRHLVAGLPPDRHAGSEAALQRLDTVLEGVGFGQAREDDDAGTELRIHHCPFLEVAGEHPAVVCTLHRGLLEGAVESLGAAVEVAGLRPFAAPGVCVATLRSTSVDDVAGSRAAVSDNRVSPEYGAP